MIQSKQSDSKPSFDKALGGAMKQLPSNAAARFIFVGNSVLHIAALNAYLLKLQDAGVVLSGVVCDDVPEARISQISRDDMYAIADESFVLLRNGSDYFKSKSSAAMKALSRLFPGFVRDKGVSKNGDASYLGFIYLFVPDDGYPPPELIKTACENAKCVKIVLLEEGVGSYRPRKAVLKSYASRRQGPFQRFILSASAGIKSCLEGHYRHLVDARFDVERFSLFKKSKGKLEENADFSEWMNESFAHQAIKKGLCGSDYSGTVVILGTQLSVVGSPELELNVLLSIIACIKACGLRPLFRPHPRNKDTAYYSELNIPIDSNPICAFEAELAMAANLPIAIVGFGSSSQIISNVLWGVPNIVISSLLLNYEQLASNRVALRRFVDDISSLEGTFSNRLSFVGSIDDLEVQIRHLVRGGA